MRFVVDENISWRVARALHALHEPGHTITTVIDTFGRSTKDQVWLRDLASDDAAVTQDERILVAHGAVVKEVKPRLIVLWGGGWGRMRLHDRTWRIIKHWPAIIAAGTQGGVHLVTINGRVSRWTG